jgi:hypothetical protein
MHERRPSRVQKEEEGRKMKCKWYGDDDDV